jgi:hypothetical protein
LLVLRAVDVASQWQWRWLLSDEESGLPLEDHVVELDPASDDVATFGDLYECARWRAAPDRRDEDEARVVARARAWAGRELLGDCSPAISALGSSHECQQIPCWVYRRRGAGQAEDLAVAEILREIAATGDKSGD